MGDNLKGLIVHRLEPDCRSEMNRIVSTQAVPFGKVSSGDDNRGRHVNVRVELPVGFKLSD